MLRYLPIDVGSFYSRSLAEGLLDIPAFQMRDVPIPFGSDLTPIKAVCASHLIANLQTGGGR
jgi:hypothetical protein